MSQHDQSLTVFLDPAENAAVGKLLQVAHYPSVATFWQRSVPPSIELPAFDAEGLAQDIEQGAAVLAGVGLLSRRTAGVGWSPAETSRLLLNVAQRIRRLYELSHHARTMKPLFVPLQGIWYDAFARGEKDLEIRKYGQGWNEQTCLPGRRVTLSRGYGSRNRMPGRITRFTVDPDVESIPEWDTVYGDDPGPAALIGISVGVQEGARYENGHGGWLDVIDVQMPGFPSYDGGLPGVTLRWGLEQFFVPAVDEASFWATWPWTDFHREPVRGGLHEHH